MTSRPSKETVTVRAKIFLLPTEQGGRKTGLREGSYRPNHNFFGPDDRTMAMGFVELPPGTELHPGESMEVQITFSAWPELASLIYPGREWRIQEGAKLVGFGTVLEVLREI